MAGNRAYLIWKGHASDQGMYYARQDPGHAIGDARRVGYFATSRGIAAVVRPTDHGILTAWRGADNDSKIWTATANFDGNSWSGQSNPLGAPRTEYRPVLGVLNDRIFMAWRGAGSDEHIWYSELGRNGWTEQRTAGNGWASSTHGPALAQSRGRLYMAWKGSGANEGLYWCSFDGSSWTDPTAFAGGSTHGPALASTGSGELVMAWSGSSGDDRLWRAYFNGAWSAQRLAVGRSSHGPALGLIGNRIVMLWKGSGSDEQLWWTRDDFYSQQLVRADYTTSDTPALVGIDFGEL